MLLRNIIIRRTVSTERTDIGQIFIKENVQRLLKEITRFDESKIFTRRPVPKLKSPNLIFMTDRQLEVARETAYENAKSRLQMPPVMAPDESKPKVLARDEEIAGYTKFKVMFVDITPGYSDRNRLMSVRELDGTLRYPTHEERSRLNHIFYPSETRSIDPPKLFEEKNLSNLLGRSEYLFVLNRACTQFEPDDPRYIQVTTTVYNHIDDKKDYDKLRSTRHFGPMSLFLAFNNRADYLILEMLSKNLIEDAAKLVRIYNTCHTIEFNDEDDDLNILQHYADNHSNKQHNLNLALKGIVSKLQANEKSNVGKQDKPETDEPTN